MRKLQENELFGGQGGVRTEGAGPQDRATGCCESAEGCPAAEATMAEARRANPVPRSPTLPRNIVLSPLYGERVGVRGSPTKPMPNRVCFSPTPPPGRFAAVARHCLAPWRGRGSALFSQKVRPQSVSRLLSCGSRLMLPHSQMPTRTHYPSPLPIKGSGCKEKASSFPAGRA